VKAPVLVRQLGIFVLLISTTTTGFSQSAKAPEPGRDAPPADLTLERVALIGELQSLERETPRFNDSLAEALAKVEIADAAWQLDRDWAKLLLRAAYELTLPKTDRQSEQSRPAGSPPPPPNSADRSRWKVRFRALEVARRDKEFADELTQMGKESMGAYGKHFAFAALADQAVEAGDVGASADYVLQGIKADPTQGTAPDIINRIAMRDRALADRLIVQYIGELRRFPIGSGNQSDIRAFFILSGLVRPYLTPDPSIKVPAPGPEAMRAYVGYMLEALNNMEQREPGYLLRRRMILLSLWPPLQQYAPEMAAAFLNLEGRSRNPGDNSPLPTAASIEAEKRLRYEKNVKKELAGDQPREATIYSAIGKSDFDKARKMIDKLPDGAKKKYLTDTVNAEEALDLIRRGNVYEAERLARELTRAASMLRIYPTLIGKCAVKKDRVCTDRLAYQALKQIKDSDASPPPTPEGIPASAVATDPRFDPVLSFIARLATDILPSGDELALGVLDELVAVANNTPAETEQARIGFGVGVFRRLAPGNETRVQQAAYSLRNPVQRVLALASIYQWKAKELTERQSKRAAQGR
jgi:hypothetical protein